MVFSGGAGSGKYDCFTFLQGPIWVRRRSRRAKWCSRVGAVRINLEKCTACKRETRFGVRRELVSEGLPSVLPQFHTFERSILGPNEVPEGKIVFSLQRGAHKFRKVHGV